MIATLVHELCRNHKKRSKKKSSVELYAKNKTFVLHFEERKGNGTSDNWNRIFSIEEINGNLKV